VHVLLTRGGFFSQEEFMATKTVKFFGTAAIALSLASLLAMSNTAVAGDTKRTRSAKTHRVTQPHARTTERQRTENGHTRRDTVTGPQGRSATRDAVVTNDRDAGTRMRNVDYTGPNGKTTSVDSVATRTDDGFTRSTTVTNPQGETSSRELSVARDKDAGLATRSATYTTPDGREGSKSDVIQRTEDGYSRDTERNFPNGETHTRSVDVACEKDVGKCVKQVEVGGLKP
jgi:hypothetical protein